MKKAFIILILFVSFRVCSQAQELRIFESLSMYSKILKQEVKYSIVLPEGYYKSKKNYPVVYMLHGLGDNESSWLEYGQVSEISGKAVKRKEIIPMIYVMPQGYRNYYVNDSAGTFLYQDMFVKELIPFIDSTYKTIANKNNRATIGYSMGGFGALVLPLKYPELFTACVPMSISIRTDSQYMEEDSNGWNDQWGRIFGGIGETGKARITEYYQQNSPFPMIELQDKKKWKDLAIYIDNGDDEETLAYSNETLHQLFLVKGISHEFRVRNGGHEFSYWRQSLFNGLRFISDKFEGRAYRGDSVVNNVMPKQPSNNLLKTVIVEGNKYNVYFPQEFNTGDRHYPVIYVIGDSSAAQSKLITSIANAQINTNLLPPFIMVFIPEQKLSATIFNEFETKCRVRPGFRFRSLIVLGKAGNVLQEALKPEQFTSCAMIDASADFENIQKTIGLINPKSIERTWYFFSTTDKSTNSKTNGDLHLLFKKKDIYHEYRVIESSTNREPINALISEVFQFTVKKMHR